MPKFSIIIPVYNAARYLRECLDSVVAQTYTDFEVICVDDGSTDGSGAILDEYAAKDRHFRVIHQPNAGAWAARNAALEVAQGEWITFVDADDRIRPGWLENAMALADDSCADLVRLRPTCEGFGGESVGIYEGNAAAEWAWETLSEYGYLWLASSERVPLAICGLDRSSIVRRTGYSLWNLSRDSARSIRGCLADMSIGLLSDRLRRRTVASSNVWHI